MTPFRRIFPMGAALAVLAMSSGCALRPVVRGELVSVSWDELAAPPPGGGGGSVEAAAAVEAQAQATAAPAQPRRVAVANESKRSAPVRVAQAPLATVTNSPTPVTRVPVTLRAKDASKHYEVTAPSGQKCTVPCTLELAPGDSLVSFTGDSTTAVWLKVPPSGGTLEFELVGTGRRVAAGVLLGIALVVSTVGAALIPVLGGIPLIILGSVGLACLIPGLILAGGSNTLDWVGEPPR